MNSIKEEAVSVAGKQKDTAQTNVLQSTINPESTDVKEKVDVLDARLKEAGIVDPEERGCYSPITTEDALKSGFSCEDADFEIQYRDLDGSKMEDNTGGVFRRLRQTVKAVARGCAKYLSLAGAGIRIFYSNYLIKNPNSEVILVTEGEKKCSVLASLLFAAMAVIGWSAWRTPGTDKLHADLTALSLKGKSIVLAPDFDVVFNHNIQRELAKLTVALYAAGVKDVRLVKIPAICADKLGIDDYLLKVISISPSDYPEAWAAQARARAGELIEKASTVTPDNCKFVLNGWLTSEINYFGRYGYTDPEPEKNFRHVLELINSEKDPILKEKIIINLCNATGVGKRAISAKLRDLKNSSKKYTSGEIPGLPLRIDMEDAYPGLSNYAEIRSENGGVDRVPLWLADIIDHFLDISCNRVVSVCRQLCSIGDNQVRVLATPAALFAFAHSVGVNAQWMNGIGFVSREEFMAALCDRVPQYATVCNHDQLIRNPEALYVFPEYPEPSGEYLKTFMEFYALDSDIDRIIFASLIAAAMFGGKSRPMYAIQSHAVRGAGKTTTAHNIAWVYGSKPLTLSRSDRRDPERSKRRMVSPSGILLDFVLLDNVTGELVSPDIADLITAPTISTMPSHGLEEIQRVNDFTWVATMNDGSFDADLASRSYNLYVQPLKYSPDWETEVGDYIKRYRWNIQADIFALLKNAEPYRSVDGTRFAMFETRIIAAFCNSQEEFDTVISELKARQLEYNAEEERGKNFAAALERLARGTLLDKFGVASLGISNAVIKELYFKNTEERLSPVQLGRKIRSLIRSGELPNLHIPENGHLNSSVRGFVWANTGVNPKLVAEIVETI